MEDGQAEGSVVWKVTLSQSSPAQIPGSKGCFVEIKRDVDSFIKSLSLVTPQQPP
jgi:hypothetical protein